MVDGFDFRTLAIPFTLIPFVTISNWSEPLRVDNQLSNFHPWRDVDEENEATLRPGIQDISSGRT
jgi:hypothetical protein